MERREIKVSPWKNALVIMAMLAFVILGAVLMLNGDGIAERAAGLLCIVFFGGFGSFALYKKSKGQGRLAILSNGLEMTMFGPRPRFIPWSDIETIGTLKVASQEFTAIRLANYGSLIDGLSHEEIQSALKQFGALRAVGYAAVAVGFANQEVSQAKDVFRFLSGSDEVKSLAGMLQHMRHTYGAEIMLGWNMRDRSANEFAKYLDQCRGAVG